MQYDYSKLMGKIVEVFKTQANFAEAIGLSSRSVSMKLNNKRSWTQPEIENAIKVLNEDEENIKDLFFRIKVQD
ncbi:MAG: DUF739 family protein [Peptoniphilaceae bacterium]|nr:DUF739 family protein [Peptoniphilaceae bacterium]MDY3075972.1 DUF739 family protein [Peptoniphilaceae bacterium]